MKLAIPLLAGLICAGYLHPAYTPSQTARGSGLRAHLTEPHLALREGAASDAQGARREHRGLGQPAGPLAGSRLIPNAPSLSARFLVTSYCLHGRTATGTYTRPGTIAVDPRVVPLRSLMSVPGYGRGQALDTGGAIRNHRLDVWYSSCRDAFAWGARWKTVRWG